MTDTDAIAREIASWFRVEARQLPWREPDVTAWGVLVSEVMLQQTPVARVLPVYGAWMARWPDATAFAAASRADILRAWDRLGYPRRALRLHDAATVIVAHHDGTVPRDLDALLALPGVGEYTARAVATFAYGDRHEVVDTNIRRVLARVVEGQGDAWPPSRRRDLDAMGALLPTDPADARLVCAGAMELGALVCTARAPRCDACPVAHLCAWREAGRPATVQRRRTQARFDGSDRQVRGIVLAALRGAARMRSDELGSLWSDDVQLRRAITGLAADGLIEVAADGSAVLPR